LFCIQFFQRFSVFILPQKLAVDIPAHDNRSCCGWTGECVGESLPVWSDILKILLLCFVAYGLSIYFYVYAQRYLGAAKTSTYYAVAPFIGVLLSFIVFREIPGVLFFIALVIMIAGTWMINKE